jgi:hypothetical protein
MFVSGAFPQNRFDFESSYLNTKRSKKSFIIINFRYGTIRK